MLALRSLFLAVLVVMALPSRARADDAHLRAFVQQVLSRNPTLRARALARESLRTRASAEGYWPDPELSVMLDRVPERMDGEMPMLRYQLSQMLMWPGKLRLMESAAAQQAESAAADADVRRLELTREAQQAYLMLVRNRGYRDVNAATLRLLDTVARAALARYGAGTGGHHEVARTDVERSVLEVEAASIEGERVSIVAMLNALRDRPPDAPFDDAGPVEASPAPAADFRELMRLAVARRPELKKMRAMVREETTMAALARRERYPDFMAGVWYNQMLGGPDTVGVMVGANIPIFSGPRQNRRAEAAELSAQSARSDATGMQAMIRYQVADALRRVQTAERTLDLVTRVARPRAEQSFASALSAYSTGSADMVFVIDAWRALQRMELVRLDAVVAQRMALVDLDWATGGAVQKGSP
jgi:cobalt-zinc-cadmium efflux system outer membrane protein